MKPIQKLDDKQSCKDVLKFLDYLRKSQCTQIYDGQNGYGIKFHTLRNNNECRKILEEMEEVAKDCSEIFGYKR
jgi:hypothetical protein